MSEAERLRWVMLSWGWHCVAAAVDQVRLAVLGYVLCLLCVLCGLCRLTASTRC